MNFLAGVLAKSVSHYAKIMWFLEGTQNLAKQGISGQIKEKQNYDKGTFHLPRQKSWQMNKTLHIAAKCGKSCRNVVQGIYRSYTFQKIKEG